MENLEFLVEPLDYLFCEFDKECKENIKNKKINLNYEIDKAFELHSTKLLYRNSNYLNNLNYNYYRLGSYNPPPKRFVIKGFND